MFIKGPHHIEKESIRTVLLIQLGDIGDVVYTFPCARAVKESLPQAMVVLAVRQKALGLARKCPWVDKSIGVQKTSGSLRRQWHEQLQFFKNLRGLHVDLAIDFRSGTRGALMAFLSGAGQRLARWASDGRLWRNRLFTHLYLPPEKKKQYIVAYMLDVLTPYGIATTHLNPEFRLDATERLAAKKILQDKGITFKRPLFAVQPYSLWHYKEWPEENLKALIALLVTASGFDVIVTGAPEERPRANKLVESFAQGVYNVVGSTPLDLLPALFRHCHYFLGVDSAGLHIAAAAGIRTFALYGPSSPETWAPRGPQHTVIRKEWPCVPCENTGCGGNRQSQCMTQLTVKEVYEIIQSQT